VIYLFLGETETDPIVGGPFDPGPVEGPDNSYEDPRDSGQSTGGNAPDRIQRMIDRLPIGNIVFNTPDFIYSDQTRLIELRSSPKASVAELKQRITAEGQVIDAEIRFDSVTEAKRRGSKFEIEELTSSIQTIGNDDTVWQWEVTPRANALGEQSLTLVINVFLKVDGEDVTKSLETFRRRLSVVVKSARVARVIRDAAWDEVAFVVPQTLRSGKSARVSFLPDQSFHEQLQGAIRAIEGISPSDYIDVRLQAALEGQHFQISDLSPVRQPIDAFESGWNWDITPEVNESGPQPINLSLGVAYLVNGEQIIESVDLLTEQIEVKASLTRLLKAQLQQHWPVILTALLIPLGVWVFSSFKGKKKRRAGF